MRQVRDDPARPDPAFAELYASLPDATDLEPWLSLSRGASPPVLYLGAGAGRLAAPLISAGIDLVLVDVHPGMVAHLRRRLPGAIIHRSSIEGLDLKERFDLVIVPSNILSDLPRLRGAARHLADAGRLAFQLTNPHWLAAGAGAGFKVIAMGRDAATAEVSYPGGTVQLAEIPLVWPEEIEDFLAAAGLELVNLFGEPGQEDGQGDRESNGEEVAGLAESPTFFTVSRRPGTGS